MNESHNYAGMLIYSMGSIKPTTCVMIKPGYIYIRDSDINKFEPKDGSMVHGHLCQILTGYLPSEISEAGGYLTGFSI